MARLLALGIPAAILLSAVLWISYTADFGLAYQGGVEAWNSGHPQRLLTWTGTPFYAVVMAGVSRIATVDLAAHVFSAINVLVWGSLLNVMWPYMADRVPPMFWWVTYGAAVIFAPAISTIFWLQPNLIVFAIALLGFALIGRRYRTVAFNARARSICLPAGMRADFGGVAKGWAADRAVLRMSEFGPALVDASPAGPAPSNPARGGTPVMGWPGEMVLSGSTGPVANRLFVGANVSLPQQAIDDVGIVSESIGESLVIRGCALAEARIVRRSDMETIRERRDQVAKHV